MGPRSLNRGNVVGGLGVYTRHVLQWGRGLSTAEISKMVWSHQSSNALQWGRGLSTAEIWALLITTPRGRLQWGRGLSTAEIGL